MLKAPQLERLILQLPGKTIRGLIWILDAPKLCVFGLPQNHVLEIRDTIIMVRTYNCLFYSLSMCHVWSWQICEGVDELTVSSLVLNWVNFSLG